MTSSYPASVVEQSMTIDEMRHMHQQALQQAEAKKTELRLVLASRYRELVGSSDEVIKMKDRSEELLDLVKNIPVLMENLPQETVPKKILEGEDTAPSQEATTTPSLQRQLSVLPRSIYRALDQDRVYDATNLLIQLFTLVKSTSDAYPVANQLARPSPPLYDSSSSNSNSNRTDSRVSARNVRLVYLQFESMPLKIKRMASQKLGRVGTSSLVTASALSALQQLSTTKTTGFPIEDYYSAKAELLTALLEKLKDGGSSNNNAQQILSQIVRILQLDILVVPYQIWIRRDHPDLPLPSASRSELQTRTSKFLATHLPLIRSKVKFVLVQIAGTTASALGKIRQSLYDQTDGAQMDDWKEAVSSLADPSFSLWSALFSQTFSSLVHSLLSTSFQSVHSQVVASLRTSLANAPKQVLPHEAYRNTLALATQLDRHLLQVSADAHELLVHAEERNESEQRLKESLYVQTCEILGRLVLELRRMIQSDHPLIVGRLCFLLKVRLTSLPTLLDARYMGQTTGLISLVDLHSAFSLADTSEGVVQFADALEAASAAFAGTKFNGVEVLKEALLLPKNEAPENLTRAEMTLLLARGVRPSPDEGALHTLQGALDDSLRQCLRRFAQLTLPVHEFKASLKDSLRRGSLSASEWDRVYGDSTTGVSPFVLAYIVRSSLTLSGATCPPDYMDPLPNSDYGVAMGVLASPSDRVDTFYDVLKSIFVEALVGSMVKIMEDSLRSADVAAFPSNAKLQLSRDVSFLRSVASSGSLGAQKTVDDLSRWMQAVVGERTSSEGLATLSSSESFVSTLFTSQGGAAYPSTEPDVMDGRDSSRLLAPLASTSRFNLLPVQSDRSVSELQLRRQSIEEDDTKTTATGNAGAGVINSGLGFFSSMLKKK